MIVRIVCPSISHSPLYPHDQEVHSNQHHPNNSTKEFLRKSYWIEPVILDSSSAESEKMCIWNLNRNLKRKMHNYINSHQLPHHISHVHQHKQAYARENDRNADLMTFSPRGSVLSWATLLSLPGKREKGSSCFSSIRVKKWMTSNVWCLVERP